MSLVPYSPLQQAVTASLQTSLGRILNLHRVLAQSPRMAEAFATLSLAVHESTLEPRLREIAYSTAVQVLDCKM